MLSKILGFIVGKSPDIFDADGNIVHQFPPEKWQAWNDRFQKSKDYNWRQHKGTEKQIKNAKPK